jgi:hypothetical protein
MRSWYRSSGDKNKLVIRRLYCRQCNTTHHELPDVLVPYKRYGVESIEPVVSDLDSIDVAADESTLYRWRDWFKVWAFYAVNCLMSIALRFQLDLPVVDSSDSPQSVLRQLGHNEGTSVKWLAKVVRPIVNVHLWVQTRSAFLSGFV